LALTCDWFRWVVVGCGSWLPTGDTQDCRQASVGLTGASRGYVPELSHVGRKACEDTKFLRRASCPQFGTPTKWEIRNGERRCETPHGFWRYRHLGVNPLR